MTVIAVKDGIMAADSAAICGGRISPSGHPKISKYPGSVAGACGRADDCYAFQLWFESGSCAPGPKFMGEGDDAPTFLMIDRGDQVWRKEGSGPWFPYDAISAIGESTAANFALGAMHAGLSAEEAVRLAIKHCVWIGGEVQVERAGGF
jgi:hypothetical protein